MVFSTKNDKMLKILIRAFIARMGVFMIKIKLSDLLGKNKMTQKALAEIAQIRPATVSKMYYEEIKRIDIKNLYIHTK